MPDTNTPPRPIPNTYWVVPSRLLAGEYPGDRGVAVARAKLRALLEGGVTHFVDLTSAGELVAYDALLREEARGLGVSAVYARHPIADISVPQTPGEMAAILDAIDAAVDVGGMVYVHCWGGVGRTGTVVGCWLVRHGHTGTGALAQVAEWWRGVEKAFRKPDSPETEEQRRYVRRWTEPGG